MVKGEVTAFDALAQFGRDLRLQRGTTGPWGIRVDRLEIKQGVALRGVAGTGDTPEAAALDLLHQLQTLPPGSRIVICAMDDAMRQEFVVLGPVLLQGVPSSRGTET